MSEFFDPNYTGNPFKLYGPGHLAFLVVDLIIILILIFGWKNPTEKGKRNARYILAGIMLLWESACISGTWRMAPGRSKNISPCISVAL